MSVMLIENAEGFRPVKTQNVVSDIVKEVVAHLKGNCTTGGFSVQYAVNDKTEEVIEVFKKGRVCQRDVKALVAQGFTEWIYSWAWAGSNFLVNGNKTKVSRRVDLVKQKDIEPYRGLLR